MEEESREAANTSVKTTSMLRPVTDIRAIMTPAESPCAAVVNRLVRRKRTYLVSSSAGP